MTEVYAYPARTAATTNARLIEQQIGALSLPGWVGWRENAARDSAGVLHLTFPNTLSVPQKASLDRVLTAHVHTQRTAAQQAALDAAAARPTQETLLASIEAATTVIELRQRIAAYLRAYR